MGRQKAERIIGDVGRRVAEIRAERGLTQEQLAERAGVLPKYIQRIEWGRENLSIESLVNLANLLRTDVKALFEEPQTRRRRRPGRPRKTASAG